MKTSLFLIFMFVGLNFAYAADSNYPELMVSPRASERVLIEAQKERRLGLVFNLPVQISSAMTLVTGVSMLSSVDKNKDPENYSPWIGIGTGATWLLLNSYLGYFHQPYMTAHREIANLSTKTPHEELIKERLAEEAIEKAGSLAKKLNWFSALTNLSASIYMVSKAEKKSTGQVFGVLSAISSLLPLVFEPEWTRIRDEQNNYKKRIYGPLSVVPAILPSPEGKLAQGMVLHYSF